jgi:hypothetical protein
VFYLGECLVSWLRKKQSPISLSTAEAKHIATTSCCTQVVWMKQTLTDIQVEYDEPIPIYCDNTSAISISKKPDDALQDEAHSNQVSIYTRTGCGEEHQS